MKTYEENHKKQNFIHDYLKQTASQWWFVLSCANLKKKTTGIRYSWEPMVSSKSINHQVLCASQFSNPTFTRRRLQWRLYAVLVLSKANNCNARSKTRSRIVEIGNLISWTNMAALACTIKSGTCKSPLFHEEKDGATIWDLFSATTHRRCDTNTLAWSY